MNGSPHSDQVKFTERIRRPTFGKLEIDLTIEDPKAYTKPFTVRINQRVMVDNELIEFICHKNQQFRRRVKVDLTAIEDDRRRPGERLDVAAGRRQGDRRLLVRTRGE